MSVPKANSIESAETPFSRTRTHAAGVEATLSSTEMTRARHSDVEDLIEAQGREWARLMLEEHLALRAAIQTARSGRPPPTRASKTPRRRPPATRLASLHHLHLRLRLRPARRSELRLERRAAGRTGRLLRASASRAATARTA